MYPSRVIVSKDDFRLTRDKSNASAIRNGLRYDYFRVNDLSKMEESLLKTLDEIVDQTLDQVKKSKFRSRG